MWNDLLKVKQLLKGKAGIQDTNPGQPKSTHGTLNYYAYIAFLDCTATQQSKVDSETFFFIQSLAKVTHEA